MTLFHFERAYMIVDQYCVPFSMPVHVFQVPSLAGACLSGVALVQKRYPEGRPVPPAIAKTMQILAAFGIFWAIADRASQKAEKPNDVFWFRTSINVISCGLVIYLRKLMANVNAPILN
jgi:hypothetical protein